LIVVAGIGDFVMATQAIRAVRNGHPHAEIHLLTSSEGAILAQRHPALDKVFAFPIREMRANWFSVWPVLCVIRQLRRTRYDIAANLYPVCSSIGSARMALLFGLLKAHIKVGHASGLLRFCLNGRVPDRVFSGRHRVEAMTEVARAIGGQSGDDQLEMSADGGREQWSRLVAPFTDGRTGLLIGINPGGERANRRWPPGNFVAVARALGERVGARVLIFGGPGEESIAGEILKPLNGSAVNLAGRLALHELPYFLSRCDLFITNDSGPMHLAAAMQVPVVAIFGPENPNVFRPYTSPERSRVLQQPVNCRPCTQASCAHPICLESISPADVLTASLELLAMPTVRNAAGGFTGCL
jgi:heptosyltransferase II